MKFNDLYASETRNLYEVAMTVYAIEKFFDPDTTDSELCALDLGEPMFAHDGDKVIGFATVVQTADPEEDEPIYYHLLGVYKDEKIYALISNCPESKMFEIPLDVWTATEYHQPV